MKPELALDLTTNVDTADFSQNLQLLDTNVKKTGDLITLNYEEVDWINQPLASRVENVNPFNMVEFLGNIELKPFADTWVRNVFVDGGVRRLTQGNRNRRFIETLLTNQAPDTHIRSRNVAFTANGLRPVATKLATVSKTLFRN